MTLGKKLMLGFIIPPLMLMAAGLWSYTRFNNLSNRVDAMLHENDRSIQAAAQMTEALERMDSATLMMVAGQPENAEPVLLDADSLFHNALRTAIGNVTIESEPIILDSLKASYETYEAAMEDFRSDPSFSVYSNEVMPAFLQTKQYIRRLRSLNADEMYSRAIYIGQQAYRATLPGTILMIAAVIFTLMFAWLIREHAVKPMRRLLKAAEQWPATGHFRNPEIETGDELEQLAEAMETVDRTFNRGKDR